MKSADPVAAAIEVYGSMPEDGPDHPDTMPIAFAMIGNLDAIARYSRSINDMLRISRENNDPKPLFQALSVDSYISTIGTVQAAMRLEQLSGSSQIADVVFKSIKGPHKKRLVYPKLRWLEYLLRDQNAFESCTQEEIHVLVVNHLKLYDDDTKKKYSKKSLFMLFRKWQQKAGIQKPVFR